MPQDFMNRLRSSYDILAQTGEWPTDGLLASDFELHQDAFVDTAKVFHGPDAARQLMRNFKQAIRDVSLEAERFIEGPAGEVVVIVRARGRGQGSGIAIDKQQAHVWTFTGDKAARMVIYGQPAEAFRAVGLPE